MKAQETPSGTRMMWKASVNAICERAQGTGSAVEIRTTTWAAALTTTGTSSWAHRPPTAHPCSDDTTSVSREAAYGITRSG